MIFQFSKCSKLVLMEHRDLHKLADRLGDPGELTGLVVHYSLFQYISTVAVCSKGEKK